MFMRQKQNETALTVPHGPFIYSDQSLNHSAAQAHYKLEINKDFTFIVIIIDIDWYEKKP